MMEENYINDGYILNSAKEAKEYYFECMKKKINSRIKQACEAGGCSTDIKLLPDNIQQELKNIGYEIINTPQNTIIKW